MNIRIEQTGDCLVLSPTGRLDGYGSEHLQQALVASMTDAVTIVLFDLTDVPYMSSAGIRVLLIARNMVKDKGGNVILCNCCTFIQNVLKMAGMDKIFQNEPDRDKALSTINIGKKSDIPREGPFLYELDSGVMEISPAGTEKSVLRISGSLTRVLHAQIDPESVFQIRFSDCEYSLGLGALAEDPDQARHLLGEMITLHGSIVWLPTDGNGVPDFFIPVQDSGIIKIFTGFNAALHGPFHEIITFSPNAPEGITLTRLYQGIFERARKIREDYSGIIAIALMGEVGGIRRSGIIHSPIPEYAPLDGESIMDPHHVKEWIEVSDTCQYEGDIIVAFGVGIDLSYDLSGFEPSQLSALSYIHPANRGNLDMSLHTHGVVFKKMNFSPGTDLEERIKEILNTGEFLDMCHLMDDTRIRNVQIAVAYISDIVLEKPNDF